MGLFTYGNVSVITFLIFGLNFNRTSFDDPIAQGSDDAEPLTGEVLHGHDGGEATGPSFEAIVDRFKSLDEVRKAIKAEGLEECGLIFGKLFELFKRLRYGCASHFTETYPNHILGLRKN